MSENIIPVFILQRAVICVQDYVKFYLFKKIEGCFGTQNLNCSDCQLLRAVNYYSCPRFVNRSLCVA